MQQSKSTLSNTEAPAVPVVITVRGEQRFDGVEPDATELMTEGTMALLPDGLRLTYQETELTGMEGTTTAFELRGERMVLSRTGKVNSRMIFEEGRSHTSLYETPFGDLTVDVQTSYLRHNLSERGGLLELRYSVAVEQTVTGNNRVSIRVRKKS